LSSEKDKDYNNDHCSSNNKNDDNSYATYLELHALNKVLTQVHNPITIHSQTERANPFAKLHFIALYFTPPSRAKVKERVKLYTYSPSGPSCPVLG